MRWYIKTAPKIGNGTEDDPYRPDLSLYPTVQQWSIVAEYPTYYVVKLYM